MLEPPVHCDRPTREIASNEHYKEVPVLHHRATPARGRNRCPLRPVPPENRRSKATKMTQHFNSPLANMIRMLALRCVRTALVLAGAAVVLCGREASPANRPPSSSRSRPRYERLGPIRRRHLETGAHRHRNPQRKRPRRRHHAHRNQNHARCEPTRASWLCGSTPRSTWPASDSKANPKRSSAATTAKAPVTSRRSRNLLGTEMVTIEGRQVPCQIRQVVTANGQQKQLVRMFLSDDVEPFVLKRETIPLKNDGNSPAIRKPPPK